MKYYDGWEKAIVFDLTKKKQGKKLSIFVSNLTDFFPVYFSV